ncbi:MAG TPA: hypothetical protein DCQ98_21755 [Planctomycetaceae bacterium]|nr:hypothetical protein [Planctomycetaceae bacterium]
MREPGHDPSLDTSGGGKSSGRSAGSGAGGTLIIPDRRGTSNELLVFATFVNSVVIKAFGDS